MTTSDSDIDTKSYITNSQADWLIANATPTRHTRFNFTLSGIARKPNRLNLWLEEREDASLPFSKIFRSFVFFCPSLTTGARCL